ncbi:uncharacterized protein BX663DRAFT_508860 [Cokeromyces recurvatus]|uniref:uncharacterized protein n=1 Tax=Cokeromyces recurvatus TaxID=90255 RepID=UPI002220BC7C|nr:uncharacterized protein BX663DRAFT_508860 [Cokeromyces recurvatus]KAI7902922.1 hypothetical protein BX663DRAFT_508860 [Cokeromyces recurvatus]
MTLFPPEEYLRTLPAIREQCRKVYDQVRSGHPSCSFQIDEAALPRIVEHVTTTTLNRYPNLNTIPPHSRLRHFDPNNQLFAEFETKTDKVEATRGLVDLVLVSVLLDAGAGSDWKYRSQDGKRIGRSEGLALASFDMFVQGYFSKDMKPVVDVQGLRSLTVEQMQKGFQVTDKNFMVGLEGRTNLLKSLANVLDSQPTYFPIANNESRRPGHLIDYILSSAKDESSIHINKIWEAVMSLGDIWPSRIKLNGIPLGDVWPYLDDHELIPFHKLSQWLTYSLVEVIETYLGLRVTGTELLTGLPEYRNGGLLVDYGLLKLKESKIKERQDGLPIFEGSDPTIVEWRALTVIYLDRIKEEVEIKLDRKLDLAQVLEGGTWTAGREIAARLRPNNGGPPIIIKSDGTIF